ncbi:MAG TPA: OmpA family protein [Terriglobales bacterium]|nr:OmpA family protein [Terriglobales bacterium]
MKRIVVVVLLTGIALAQQPAQPAASAPQVAETNIVAKVQAPTYSDVNCAGFITDQPVPKDKYVAAGWATPHQTKFAARDYVYLSGSGFQEGQRYSIVRHIQDPNVMHYFDDQSRLIGDSGKPYADVGRVLVIGLNGSTAITQVEFACDAMVPGDVAVPFAAREIPALRPASRFDRFAPPNGKLTGRIIMAKDFDAEVGAGRKVYLNVGSGQGVKVGDYFRVTRTYKDIRRERTDSLSYKVYQSEDTQKDPATFPYTRIGELPRISLGELVVLAVTPKSSTGMITFSLEDIVVGDGVEMEEPPPPAPPAPAAAMNPPTISCMAKPATIRVGESSTITCDASSPDNRPLQFAFASNGGAMTQRDNVGMLTSNDVGSISVKATATDDRNLSAVALTTVNVEAPPAAPTASKMNEIAFKNNSAYVDNRAKAVLDDVALKLQQDPNSAVTLVGMADAKEAGAKRLAERRATNAAAYLSKSKGIDAARIHTKGGTEGGKKADIWMVPAGAQAP